MSSRQMALSGILSALAAVFLTAGGMLGIATYCAPILAMATLLPVLEECGPKAAGAAWGAVSLLGLLLSPDRELALVYAAFGWYPILRPRIWRISSRLLRLLAKLGIGGGMLLLLYGFLLRLMGLTADLLSSTPWLNALLLVLGIAVFLLLDLCLKRLTDLWRVKFRKRFFKS